MTALKEKRVSAYCIDTHSPAYLCISPVLEHTIYKQTKNPQKETWTTTTPFPRPHKPSIDTHSQMYGVTCTVAPTVSHSSASHTGRQTAAKDFAFINRKTRGQLFGCSIVCDSLSFPPSEQQLSLSFSLFPPPLVSISTSERWAVERVHFQKQGKGSDFWVFFVCILVQYIVAYDDCDWKEAGRVR